MTKIIKFKSIENADVQFGRKLVNDLLEEDPDLDRMEMEILKEQAISCIRSKKARNDFTYGFDSQVFRRTCQSIKDQMKDGVDGSPIPDTVQKTGGF